MDMGEEQEGIGGVKHGVGVGSIASVKVKSMGVSRDVVVRMVNWAYCVRKEIVKGYW